MLKIVLILSLSTLCLSCFSQEYIHVRGKIVSKSDNRNLSYSTIQVTSTGISLTASEVGEFELHLPSTSQKDTLLISCVGFEKYRRPVRDVISKQDTLFALTEKPYELNEVTILPTSSVEEIVNNVKVFSARNYTSSRFYIDGFFTRYTKADQEPAVFSEAAIVIEGDGFNTTKKRWITNKAYVREVRSIPYQTNIVDVVDHSNMLWSLVKGREQAIIESLVSFKADLRIDKIEFEGNDRIIFLSYEKIDNSLHKKLIRRYKVNSTDWALTGYESETTYIDPQNTKPVRLCRCNDSLNLREYSSFGKVKFIKVDGKYYLGYDYAQYNRDIISPHKTYSCTNIIEYSTSKVFFDKPDYLLKENLINIHRSLNKQTLKLPYRPDFWKHYNILQDSQEIEEIKKELSKKVALDGQYHNLDKTTN